MTDLGRDSNRRDVTAIATHLDQRGLRRYVEIPDIVMNGLKAPDNLPRRAAERDDGAGVIVAASTFTSKIVRAGVAGRQENQISLLIHRDDRPHIGRPKLIPIRAGCCLFKSWRDRIPAPTHLARANIVRSDDSAWSGNPIVVADRRAYDNQIFYDCVRRSHLILAGIALVDPYPGFQIDLPALAEIRAGFSIERIERNQT